MSHAPWILPWRWNMYHDATCVPWLLHVCHDSYICAMTHTQIGGPARRSATPRSFSCGMTHIYVPWLIHMCHDSYICAMTHTYVPWHIHIYHDSYTCAMTHTYVCHDSYTPAVPRGFWRQLDHTHVIWLIHMCHDSYIYAMTHTFVCVDSYICVPWLIHTSGPASILATTRSYSLHSFGSGVPRLSAAAVLPVWQ